MKTNLKKVAKKIDSVIDCVNRDRVVIELAALEQGKALMINRIFGSGANAGGFSLDGSGFGEYSEPYLRKRLKKGLINLQKNLFFEGNLQHSIQVGSSANGNKIALGFVDQDLADIARFQEESDVQINEPIFGFNSDEMEICLDVIRKGIQISLKKCFNKA